MKVWILSIDKLDLDGDWFSVIDSVYTTQEAAAIAEFELSKVNPGWYFEIIEQEVQP